MSVDKDNVIQSFGWFKQLMDADLDAKLAGLSYTLPTATQHDLGGVKIGDGLAMDANDRLNVTISGGDENIIEVISVDGTPQPVTNKTAALNLSAYAKKTDVTNALSSISSLSLAISSLKVGDTNVIEAIAVDGTTVQPDASKTVNLNLSATYAKKNEVASGVRMKGSVDFFSDLANLPEAPAVGDLYNIKTAGGNDGDGTPILAGDNVVYTDKGTWDVMAGFVDTSRFVEKVAGKQLSSNDFTNADKAKLDSLSNTTYTLPAATTTTRGGIRPGVGLEMRTLLSGGNTDILDCTPFIGATETTAGVAGLVPAPLPSQREDFLCGEGYWTPLPTASTTTKGGVIIGAGLSMSGDTLSVTLESGGTYDNFTGATSIVGGASGLVPAPLAGADSKFLCGNGKWEDIGKHVSIVNTGGSTGVVIGKDPTAVQGALWMDYTSDGTAVLKLRNGDYEYNFIPDSSNYGGSNLPALDTSNKGQIYYLGTTPATTNGGLWYEMDGDTPKLGLRYGQNLTFDFFYLPNSTTYKGGADGLYSYLPLQANVADAFGNTWASNRPEFYFTKLANGVSALKSTSPDIKSYSANKQGLMHTFSTPLSTFTIDFWLSWDSSDGLRYYSYAAGTTTGNHVSTLRICGTKTDGKVFGLDPSNTDDHVQNATGLRTSPKTLVFSCVAPQIILINNTTTFTPRRIHIALTHTGEEGVKVYMNGQYIGTTGAIRNITYVAIQSSVEKEGASGIKPEYLDHFRIWNKIVWYGNFDPPSMDSYV